MEQAATPTITLTLLPNCCGDEGAEPEGEDLNLLVNLQYIPPLTCAHDQKNVNLDAFVLRECEEGVWSTNGASFTSKEAT